MFDAEAEAKILSVGVPACHEVVASMNSIVD